MAEVAALICQAPRAAITLVPGPEPSTAWADGAGSPSVRESGALSRDPLWRMVAYGSGILSIDDTRNDPRTLRNVAVEAEGLGAYLGVPIRLADGAPGGVLAVLDTRRRRWSERHRRALTTLAGCVGDGGLLDARGELTDHSARTPLRLMPEIPAQRSPGLGSRLADAVREGAVDVYYQPVVDLTTDAAVGAEALARWTDPVSGPVPPAVFVPLAERSGIMDEFGMHVLQVVAGHLAAVDSEWLPRAAVNVSPVQLADPAFSGAVEKLLAGFGVDPQRLTVEVTESRLTGRWTLGNLTALRELGVTIAIDDFGTGYSSLSRLQTLPVDVLKIDRSFITTMLAGSQVGTGVLRGVVHIASALGLRTVAEGVETAQQAEVLKDIGVDQAQGWLYAAAMPADRLGAWYRGRAGEQR